MPKPKPMTAKITKKLCREIAADLHGFQFRHVALTAKQMAEYLYDWFVAHDPGGVVNP